MKKFLNSSYSLLGPAALLLGGIYGINSLKNTLETRVAEHKKVIAKLDSALDALKVEMLRERELDNAKAAEDTIVQKNIQPDPIPANSPKKDPPKSNKPIKQDSKPKNPPKEKTEDKTNNAEDKPVRKSGRFVFNSKTDKCFLENMYCVSELKLVVKINPSTQKIHNAATSLKFTLTDKHYSRPTTEKVAFSSSGSQIKGDEITITFSQTRYAYDTGSDLNPMAGNYRRALKFVGTYENGEWLNGYLQWEEQLPNGRNSGPLVYPVRAEVFR